jgi:adenylate kinase
MSAATIVLLGPPGSGKGTQTARLRDEQGLVALVTGDLLRRARADGTELGLHAAEYMTRGELVPDALIVGMLGEAIAGAGDAPIVLDGFPRTIVQADALAPALESHARELTTVVLIDVPDEVAAVRIGGRDEGREDDNPETIRARLRVYHEETEPLVDYYEERGLLLRVDGAGTPDEVNTAIREALEAAASVT